jgi:C4-dicarboxylate transporter
MAAMHLASRRRTVLAAILLLCAAAVIAVAVSQWLFGVGLDPRDDTIRRAAGIGFTDEARETLFSVLPVVLPAVAAFLAPDTRPGRVITRLTRLVYVLYIVIGVLLAMSAARYGFDEPRQLAEEGQVFIDPRAAVERLTLDAVWLTLAVIGLVVTRWNGTRVRHTTEEPVKLSPPQA